MSILRIRRDLKSAAIIGGIVWSCATAATRYVAPEHPAAADAGTGEVHAPYRTLRHAMRELMPGDTLLIAPGVYRESLLFAKRAWSAQRPTVVAGTGEVTLLGTDVVDGWRSIGGGRYARRNWDEEPQQILFRGKRLRQIAGTVFNGYPERPGHTLADLHRSQGGIWPTRLVGGRNDMPEDSFYYDAKLQELVIRTAKTPGPSEVEVATRAFLARGMELSGITLRNIRFRYASTSTTSRQGAVTLHGNDNRLERLIVEDVDGTGVQIEGDDNQIVHCVIARAGYLGLKARGKRNWIADNRIVHNNTRGFNKWWEAGGMKFIGNGGLQDSRVEGNVVLHNNGDGIWFDWGNDANLIRHNVSAYNTGFGIHYEASSRASIVGNQVFGNGQRGIYLYQSRDSIVKENVVIANKLEGVVVMSDIRRDPEGKLDLQPAENRIVGNLIGWNGGVAVILPAKIHANQSDHNYFLHSRRDSGFAMEWPSLRNPVLTLAEWRRRTGHDRTSVTVLAMMTTMVSEALARLEEAPDWTSLNTMAADFPLTGIGLVGRSRKQLPER